MQKMKKPTVLILLLGLIVALVFAVVRLESLWHLFSSREQMEAAVEGAGFWGPLVLIGLQILQVLVAPIPGQVTGFVSGYLYGTALGTFYAMVGATLGFTIVFILSRKFGRPFVEYFVDKKTLKKFDYLAGNKGVFIFFLIFLLPFFPDDLICYIAGLTKIPIRTLIIISFLGRLPSNLVLAFAGAGVADANFRSVLFVVTAVLMVSAVAWWRREQIERFVKGLSRPRS